MLSEIELLERIRSGRKFKLTAYPWGIEFEGGDS